MLAKQSRDSRLPPPPAHPQNDRVKLGLPLLDGSLTESSFCHACWSGDYPIAFTPAEKKQQLPLLHV
jgi:hypothetical protein